MSLPIGPGDGKAKVDPLLVSSTTLDQQQQQQQQPGSSSPWRTLNANNSDSLLVQNNNKKKNKLDVAWFWWDDDDDHINPEESDEDMFTVPDVEAMSSITANTNAINNKKNPDDHHTTGFPGKRRRGRNPVDKEYRRLKRLLRNRVSAQQARERKKVYVNDLESRAGELENSNSKLEEKISTLINENTMLRKVLMNTRPKVDESIEQKQDQLSKS